MKQTVQCAKCKAPWHCIRKICTAGPCPSWPNTNTNTNTFVDTSIVTNETHCAAAKKCQCLRKICTPGPWPQLAAAGLAQSFDFKFDRRQILAVNFTTANF